MHDLHYCFFFFTADALLSSIRDVPLKGVAIGNGWIDPKTQYKSYIDYSVKAGILEENSAVRGHLGFVRTTTDINPILKIGLERSQGSHGCLFNSNREGRKLDGD